MSVASNFNVGDEVTIVPDAFWYARTRAEDPAVEPHVIDPVLYEASVSPVIIVAAVVIDAAETIEFRLAGTAANAAAARGATRLPLESNV
jgi:hypothetical protein